MRFNHSIDTTILITFIVLVIGISTGLMQNVSVSTDIHIWAMFLFNCLFAVLYEAFSRRSVDSWIDIK